MPREATRGKIDKHREKPPYYQRTGTAFTCLLVGFCTLRLEHHTLGDKPKTLNIFYLSRFECYQSSSSCPDLWASITAMTSNVSLIFQRNRCFRIELCFPSSSVQSLYRETIKKKSKYKGN